MSSETISGGAAAPSCGTLERVVLTGFMGSGKSTVGRLLAAHLGWQFVDLDEEIARREDRSVPAIFEQSGEAFFRALETSTLRGMLQRSQLVLALGGGTATVSANCDLLRTSERTVVVFLTAAFEVLYARCVQQSADPAATFRPLLGDANAARQRHADREKHYQQAATFTLDTTELSPEATVSALTGRLLQRHLGGSS